MSVNQIDGLSQATRSWDFRFYQNRAASDPTNITVTLARLDTHGKPVIVETKTKADLTNLGTAIYRYTTKPGTPGEYQCRLVTSGDPYTVDTIFKFEVPRALTGT